MKVLKFGGTSVGSAKNINKVISILNKSSKKDHLVVVVSAIGGITDKLHYAASTACEKNEDYISIYKSIKQKHIDVINELATTNNIDSVKADLIGDVIFELEKLKSFLDGIYLINELSPKTTDKLLSFGEHLSSMIISKVMNTMSFDTALKNAHELIITDNDFTKANVDFETTNLNIKSFFNNKKVPITIIPGFTSKSKGGEITTLGRGGSD
ncbi:MAG: bifunctional aspartate kinase/homoserine dehydrogenase I, partial [Bacteroidota bacterium]